MVNLWPFKDTHRENTPSNKTQTFTESVNMNVWVVSTPNQLSISTFNSSLGKSEMVKLTMN